MSYSNLQTSEGQGPVPFAQVNSLPQGPPAEIISEAEQTIPEGMMVGYKPTIQQQEPQANEETENSKEQIILPESDGSEQAELVTQDISEVVMQGNALPVLTAIKGNEFSLPAVLVDLSQCGTVLQIALNGLATFLFNPSAKVTRDVEEGKRCHVYIKNSNGDIQKATYGDRVQIFRDLPFYVEHAFGDKATVKEIIAKPDRTGYKLRRLNGTIKSVSLNFDYWF